MVNVHTAWHRVLTEVAWDSVPGDLRGGRHTSQQLQCVKMEYEKDVCDPCSSGGCPGPGAGARLLWGDPSACPPGRTVLSQAGGAGAGAAASSGPPPPPPAPSKAVSWPAGKEQQATVFALDRARSVFPDGAGTGRELWQGEDGHLFHLPWQREDTDLSFLFFMKSDKFLLKPQAGYALDLS